MGHEYVPKNGCLLWISRRKQGVILYFQRATPSFVPNGNKIYKDIRRRSLDGGGSYSYTTRCKL
jgi:hypothetical protein